MYILLCKVELADYCDFYSDYSTITQTTTPQLLKLQYLCPISTKFKGVARGLVRIVMASWRLEWLLKVIAI
jgi:hypothetical protein